MKKALILLFSFLAIAADSYSQTKEVLGSIEAGCTVFNYNFKRTSDGLYSFRLEDPQKETVLQIGDKDSLNKLVANLTKLKVCSTASRSSSSAVTGTAIISPAAQALGQKLANIAKDMSSGNGSIDYFLKKRDSIHLLIAEADTTNLNNFICDSTNSYGVSGFLELLGLAVNEVGKINDSRTFTLNEFEQDEFVTLAVKLINKRKSLFMSECSIVDVNKKATAMFFDIRAKLDFNDDQPATAVLRLKSLSVYSYLGTGRVRKRGSDTANKVGEKLEIEDVQIEFEDGTIKNLFVDVKTREKNGSLSRTTRFQNSYPISISSKTDPRIFEKTVLFAVNPKDVNDTARKSAFIFVSSFLDYQVIAENDREDYSPQNCVVKLNKASTAIHVVKERRSKILTVRAFTDFIGMQKDEPNGILQFEAAKKINFNTAKYGYNMFYHSFFTYVEPLLAFTKIEKENNALELTAANLDIAEAAKGNKLFDVRAIDIFRYQKLSFEVNLNVAKLNFPEIKSNLQINSNIGIMRTNVVDTINVSSTGISHAGEPYYIDVNTMRWGGSVIWELKPEGRYGISFGWDLRRLRLLNDSYNISLSKRQTIHTVWTDAYLKTNDDNKLFFRTRFSFDNDSPKKNFLQMQLGYLVNLFKGQK